MGGEGRSLDGWVWCEAHFVELQKIVTAAVLAVLEAAVAADAVGRDGCEASCQSKDGEELHREFDV